VCAQRTRKRSQISFWELEASKVSQEGYLFLGYMSRHCARRFGDHITTMYYIHHRVKWLLSRKEIRRSASRRSMVKEIKTYGKASYEAVNFANLSKPSIRSWRRDP
jgi:hypothetical protein